MKLINVVVTVLIGSTFIGQSTIFSVSATKAGVEVKLLGKNAVGMVTTYGGQAAAHGFNARDTTTVSGGSLGLFEGNKEAAIDILGRHNGHGDTTNALFGAARALQTVTIKETCGTFGSLTTTIVAPFTTYGFASHTHVNTCTPGSCYIGSSVKPSNKTNISATMDLLGSKVTLTTTEVPGSIMYKQTAVSSTTANTILNGTNTISDGTPTSYGPTAPPTAFEPATGEASNMEINLFLGGCLMALVL